MKKTNTPDIRELMQVPPSQHDIDWLMQALQAAVRLELSTLPPYLCAMWSIVVPDPTNPPPVYNLILGIAEEEMLHMAQACNLLTTIGGTPVFNTSETVPTYPGHLPGGVHPSLIVTLQRLSLDALKDTFMVIELPEGGPVAMLREGETFPTIGSFYDAIAAAFAALPPEAITGKGQVTFEFNDTEESLISITCAKDAQDAITMIKDQGEGTSTSPDVPTTMSGDVSEFAHYYKFAEIFHGKTLVQGTDGDWTYTGPAVPFPDVYSVAPVPPGGYPHSPLAQAFDGKFTDLLNTLQSAWAPGQTDGANIVVSALSIMHDLTVAALAMINPPEGQIPLLPDFILLPSPG